MYPSYFPFWTGYSRKRKYNMALENQTPASLFQIVSCNHLPVSPIHNEVLSSSSSSLKDRLSFWSTSLNARSCFAHVFINLNYTHFSYTFDKIRQNAYWTIILNVVSVFHLKNERFFASFILSNISLCRQAFLRTNFRNSFKAFS